MIGPSADQNTLFLSSTVDQLLIQKLTHLWQSQHHFYPTNTLCDSFQSQAMADALGESAYWDIPDKSLGEYAGEQTAEQVEAGEAPIRTPCARCRPGSLSPTTPLA
jgi:hypothetical protein